MTRSLLVAIDNPIQKPFAIIDWNFSDAVGCEFIFPVTVSRDDLWLIVDVPIAKRDHLKFKESKNAFIRLRISEDNKVVTSIHGNLQPGEGLFSFECLVKIGGVNIPQISRGVMTDSVENTMGDMVIADVEPDTHRHLSPGMMYVHTYHHETDEYVKATKVLVESLYRDRLFSLTEPSYTSPFMKEITLKQKEKDQLGKRKHDPRLMADLIEARKQAKKEKIAKLLAKRKNRS